MSELTTFAGYRIKGHRSLSHWEPLLEEWLLATERYCRVMEGEDAPYFYNERANIGVLAGAAWRCGRIALEEFQHLKGFRNHPKTKGRADLYIAWDKGEELVEAKLRWLRLDLKSQKQIELSEMLLASARADARKARGNDSWISCIALAFLPCWLSVAKRNDLSENIEKTVRSFQMSKLAAVAWSFPNHSRDIESDQTGNCIPGIIMIAESCRR